MGEGVIGFGGGGENRNVHIIIITYLTVTQPQKKKKGLLQDPNVDAAITLGVLFVVIVSIKAQRIASHVGLHIHTCVRARGRAGTHTDGIMG